MHPTRILPLLAVAVGILAPVHAQTTAPPSSPAPLAPAPSWDVLKQGYAPSPRPLAPVETPGETETARTIALTLTAADGTAIPAMFWRPKADGGVRYPVVLLLHGRGSTKEQWFSFYGAELLRRGFAVLALDARLHGARKVAGKDPVDPFVFTALVPDTVRDYRRALDWLTARPDVDRRRIGLFGYSMGAIQGAILAGVDPRVSASLLCVGGDPIRLGISLASPQFRPTAELACPSFFLGHAAPHPVYLLNGTQDTLISPAAARLLQESAAEPKTVVWAEAGHLLPVPDVLKGVDWLTQRLTAAR
jgi:dienelactone hydrolase